MIESKQGSRATCAAAAAIVLATAGGAGAADVVRGTTIHDAALEQVVNVRLGVAASDLFAIEAELTPGVALAATIPVDGQVVTLDLVPYSVRAHQYRVWESDASGTLHAVEPGPVNTMRGMVRGDRGSFVAASIVGGALYGSVELSDGAKYWFEPVTDDLQGRTGVHATYHAHDVLPTGGRCATTGLAREVADGRGAGEMTASGGDAETELAIDADFRYQNRWGDQTEARVNAVIDQMNVQYERDVGITHKIIGVVIRRFEIYTTNDSGQLISQLINQWRNNRPESDIVRDCVQLFTARQISGGVIGRAAAIGGMCTINLGYNFVWSDFNNNFACATDLSAHELGHTWNGVHCNCTNYTMNPFIVCRNQFNPSGTIPSIIAYRNSRNCLDTAPVRGRCCFDDDTCAMLFADDCVAQGGTPGPQGAQCDSCPTRPGRCCFTDGTCEVLFPEACVMEGGAPGPEDSECDGSCPPAIPDNDECIDAISIIEETVEYDSTSASTDGPALPAQCDEGFGLSFVKDVWYLYSPTCESGTRATVSLCNSGYDTRLAVYVQTGQCPGALIACNDDACGEGGLRSEVSFDVFASFVYVIRVGGFSDGGPGELVVSCGAPPECPEDLDGDEEIGFGDVLVLLAAWGPTEDCPPFAPEDLDEDCEVGFSDLLILLSAWGPCAG